ncbi:MAG: hypothetical protein HY657_04895 [Acidobacteria bacterium]|nr:hypothetical protein [Acidobacteriota bacterium]
MVAVGPNRAVLEDERAAVPIACRTAAATSPRSSGCTAARKPLYPVGAASTP